MAAVTVNSTPYPPQYNVAGSKRQQFYNVTGANSGDTLDVGLLSILKVNTDQPAVVTAYTLSSLGNGQTRIAFTTTGAFTSVNVEVLGN